MVPDIRLRHESVTGGECVFKEFIVFMILFTISAVCTFILAELREQHPENKMYKVYCVLSFIIIAVALIAGFYILRT